MILDKDKIEKAAINYSDELPYDNDFGAFIKGVEWAESQFKELLESIIFLDSDEYTDGEVIDLLVKKFNLENL